MKEGMQGILKEIPNIETLDDLMTIQNAIGVRWHEIKRAETVKFKSGDRVRWTKQYKDYTGKVVTVKISKLLVRCDDGTLWNIDAPSLRLITDE